MLDPAQRACCWGEVGVVFFLCETDKLCHLFSVRPVESVRSLSGSWAEGARPCRNGAVRSRAGTEMTVVVTMARDIFF